MDKFWAFRELLDFVANHAEVTDADMNNYCGDIEITGENDGQIIKIRVSIKDKEAENND